MTRKTDGRLLIACFGSDGTRSDCTGPEIAVALGFTARDLFPLTPTDPMDANDPMDGAA